MLLCIIVALLIIIPTIVLHFSQHFTLQCECCQRPESPTTVTNASRASPNFVSKSRKMNYCCSLVPMDEDFNFFPISFLYYMIFLVVLYLIMIALQFMDYIQYNNDSLSANIMYNNPSAWYQTHSIFKLHHISLRDSSSSSSVLLIGDFIIIYCVLLISIWNSLFLFYRYYTMFVSTKSLAEIRMISVLKRFAIFAVLYSTLFVINIHFYYWLFPALILFYAVFNCYCTYKWAAILIQHYKFLMKTEAEFEFEGDSTATALNGAYFIRSVSLICCLLHTLSLSVFIIAYNVDIIYYLPLFWSISCTLSAFNFIRNREGLKQFIFECKMCFNSQSVFKRIGVRDNMNARRPNLIDIDTNPSCILTMDALEVPSNSVQSVESIKSKKKHNETRVQKADVDLMIQIKGNFTGSSPALLTYAGVERGLIPKESAEVATKSASNLLQLQRNSNSRSKESDHRTPTLQALNNSDSRQSIINALDLVSGHQVRVVCVPTGFDPAQRRRSNSVPINIATMLKHEQIDVDQVLRTFSLLAQYGFCANDTL